VSHWRGVILARRRRPSSAWVPDPGSVATGPFVLEGDPAMRDEVAKALGLPR
jgi:hypothetical protein